MIRNITKMQMTATRWIFLMCIAVSSPRVLANASPSKLSIPKDKETTILFTTGLGGDSMINLTLENGEVSISFSSGEGRIINSATLVGGNSISFQCHAATIKSISTEASWGSYTITAPQPKQAEQRGAALDTAAAAKVTTKMNEVKAVIAKKPESGDLVKELVTKAGELVSLTEALLPPKPAGGMSEGTPPPAGGLSDETPPPAGGLPAEQPAE